MPLKSPQYFIMGHLPSRRVWIQSADAALQDSSLLCFTKFSGFELSGGHNEDRLYAIRIP